MVVEVIDHVAWPQKNAIYPKRTLPVLKLDDGTFISESTAITECLDGNPTLTGWTLREKPMIHMNAQAVYSSGTLIYFSASSGESKH